MSYVICVFPPLEAGSACLRYADSRWVVRACKLHCRILGPHISLQPAPPTIILCHPSQHPETMAPIDSRVDHDTVERKLMHSSKQTTQRLLTPAPQSSSRTSYRTYTRSWYRCRPTIRWVVPARMSCPTKCTCHETKNPKCMEPRRTGHLLIQKAPPRALSQKNTLPVPPDTTHDRLTAQRPAVGSA